MNGAPARAIIRSATPAVNVTRRKRRVNRTPGNPAVRFTRMFDLYALYHDWPGWDDELADVEQRIVEYYPHLKIGKEWKYNGVGNTLGSKIIETITGEALPSSGEHCHCAGASFDVHCNIVANSFLQSKFIDGVMAANATQLSWQGVSTQASVFCIAHCAVQA